MGRNTGIFARILALTHVSSSVSRRAVNSGASPLRRNRPLLLLRNRPGSNPERARNASSQPPWGGERGPFSVGTLSPRISAGHLEVAGDNQNSPRGEDVDRSDLVAPDLGHGPLYRPPGVAFHVRPPAAPGLLDQALVDPLRFPSSFEHSADPAPLLP